MLGYGASTHRDCHDSQMQAANLCLLIRLGLVTRFLTAPQHRGRGHLEPASVRPDLLHHLGPAPGTAHHQPGPVPGAPQARPPRRPRHPAHPAGDALHRPRPRAARKSPVAAPVRHRRPRRGNPHPQHRRPRPRVPPRPRHQQGRRHRVRALGHLHRPHPAPPAGRPHRRAGVPGRPARPCLRISRARGRCARRSRTRLYCDRGVACPPDHNGWVYTRISRSVVVFVVTDLVITGILVAGLVRVPGRLGPAVEVAGHDELCDEQPSSTEGGHLG